jgi:hypothetical protein
MAKSDWQPGTSVMPENSYRQKWDSICCEQNAAAKKVMTAQWIPHDWIMIDLC